MDAADRIFKLLKEDFGLDGATGSVQFKLKDFGIVVEQNNIIGNIIEEWLGKWLNSKNIFNIHNPGQSSPDFWLNPDNRESDWLEVKSFTGSPNFDVAAYRSFIKLIIDKPYKLQSKYLLIKYKMDGGIVTIENCWLKKIWEICCPSKKWPIKVQDKSGVIFNIRPAIWYSEKTDYSCFESLEHFLAAIEQTIYKYHDTNHLAERWSEDVIKAYKNFYGVELQIPRWMDIKAQYEKVKQ